VQKKAEAIQLMNEKRTTVQKLIDKIEQSEREVNEKLDDPIK